MSNSNGASRSHSNTPVPVSTEERAQAFQIAALASCDPRTALRVVQHEQAHPGEGASIIRTMTIRERVERALHVLRGGDR